MNKLKFRIKHNIATAISTFFSNEKKMDHFCLMYHSISNQPDLYSLTGEKFKEQINFLVSEKRNLIPFSSDEAGVSITFDDGHLDNYEMASFLFSANVPFTIFMISDFVYSSHKDYLNKEHLVELARSPLCTIGTHGKTHRPLVQLPFAEAEEELRVSKLELENLLGQAVTTMSFPHGSFNKELLDAAQLLGYKKCGTSTARGNPVGKDSIQIDRHCIYSCETMLSFKQKINGQWDWLAKSL